MLSRSERAVVKAWFTLAIIVGLPAGRAWDSWRAIANHDTDTIIIDYTVLIFAACGVAGISYCSWYLMQRPSLEQFLGMKRQLWLVGVPLAWLCGVAVGLLGWRYV
jgi:hypothetical protein